MILTAENTTAENGTAIHSRGTLDIDAVGVVEKPFHVIAGAGGDTLSSSFHKTRAEAAAHRYEMHAAYTQVHAL